jgi:hypothetical protein
LDKFFITVDIDWAPDWMLETVVDMLKNFNSTLGFSIEGELKKHSIKNGVFENMNVVGLFPDDFYKQNSKILKIFKK